MFHPAALLLLAFDRCIGIDAQTPNLVQAKWPSEGVDYVTGGLRKPIFDMSVLSDDNGTALAPDIIVDRPSNILNIEPGFGLKLDVSHRRTSSLSDLAEQTALRFSSKWDAAVSFQKLFSSRGLVRGAASPLGDIGLEVGGSLDSELLFSREQATRRDAEIVTVMASFDFVEVFTELPARAIYHPDFVVSVALLPARAAWDDLTPSEQRMYRIFLDNYGTHYVRAAKFGGSYESLLVMESCYLAVQEERGSDIEACATNKVTFTLSDILGIEFDILSNEECRDFTVGGSYADSWNYTHITSSQRWEGGSAAISDTDLTVENAQKWIADIKANPRSLVTQMSSVPDLLLQLLNAYPLAADFCKGCSQFQDVGVDEAGLGVRVSNMDRAFEGYMLSALEHKFEREAQCEKRCGLCDQPAEEGCVCPKITSECQFNDPDYINVYIGKIKISVDKTPGIPKAQHSPINVYVAGLGPDVDGGPYSGTLSVTVDVDASFDKRKGDVFYLEVTQPTLIATWCVGSIDFRFDHVGNGKPYALNGPCASTGAGGGGYNPRVEIIGSAKQTFSCPGDEVFYQINSSYEDPRWSRSKLIGLSVGGAVGFYLGIFL